MKTNNILKLFTLLLLVTYSVTSFGQSGFISEELIGKWQTYKKTTLEGEDGSDLTLDGSPYKVNLILNFLDEKRVLFNEEGFENEVEYQLTDNILSIKNRLYEVVKLNSKQLVLKEKSLLGGLLYLKKVNNNNGNY